MGLFEPKDACDKIAPMVKLLASAVNIKGFSKSEYCGKELLVNSCLQGLNALRTMSSCFISALVFIQRVNSLVIFAKLLIHFR